MIKAAYISNSTYHLERFLPLLLPYGRPALLAGEFFLLRLFLAMFLYLGTSLDASRVLLPRRGCLPLDCCSLALPSAKGVVPWACVPFFPASGLEAVIAVAAILSSACSASLPISPVGEIDATGVSLGIKVIGAHIPAEAETIRLELDI